MSWRPIETAPRDGTKVLVVYPVHGEEQMLLIAHQDELGWDTGYWRFHNAPTHWQPLPAPPEE